MVKLTGRLLSSQAASSSSDSLPKEWKAISKAMASTSTNAVDIWEVCDRIWMNVVPEIQDASPALQSLQKKVEGHVVTKERSPLKLFPDFNPDQPLSGLQALLTYFLPYTDLVMLVGHQGSGKTNLAWRLASAVAGMRSEVSRIPSDSVKQAKYFEARELSAHEREFLPKWKEKVDVFGVDDCIPSYLKRSDADMSQTVERNSFLEKEGILMCTTYPGQAQLLIGSNPVYRMTSDGFLRGKKMKRLKGGFGINLVAEIKDNKAIEASYASAPSKPASPASDEPSVNGTNGTSDDYLVKGGKNERFGIKMDSIIDTVPQSFVMLVGNMAKKTKFFPRSLVEYAISMQNSKPLAFQIEKGSEYIRFVGELRGFMKDYQMTKAQATDLFWQEVPDGVEDQEQTDKLQQLTDGLHDKVIAFTERWKDAYADISLILKDAMLHDMFGSIVQRGKMVIGGLVLTGQDQKDVFSQNINMEIDAYIPLLRKLAVAPISLLVPYDIRKMKGNEYACLFPVNVSRDLRVRAEDLRKETPEDAKKRAEREVEDAMGLCEFYYHLSLQRQSLKEKREAGESLAPSFEGISYFNSLQDSQLNALFKSRELKLMKLAFARYLGGPDTKSILESDDAALSRTIRDFLIATSQFSYDSGVNKQTKAKDHEPSVNVIEFSKEDAEDIVRYEIVKYLDGLEPAAKKDAAEPGLLARLLRGYTLTVPENKGNYLVSKAAGYVAAPTVVTPVGPSKAVGLFTELPGTPVQAVSRPGALTREALLSAGSPLSFLKESVEKEYVKHAKALPEFTRYLFEGPNKAVSVDGAIIDYMVFAARVTTPDGGRTFDVTGNALTLDGVTAEAIVKHTFDESITYERTKASNPALPEPEFHKLCATGGWRVQQDELGYDIEKLESLQECVEKLKTSLDGSFFPGTPSEYDSFIKGLIGWYSTKAADSSSDSIQTAMIGDYVRHSSTDPLSFPNQLKSNKLALDSLGDATSMKYQVVNETELKIVHSLRVRIPKPSYMDRKEYDGLMYTVARTYRNDAQYQDADAKDIAFRIVEHYTHPDAMNVPGTLPQVLSSKGLAMFPMQMGADKRPVLVNGNPVPLPWDGVVLEPGIDVKFCITAAPSS